jgi:hypothetical protein
MKEKMMDEYTAILNRKLDETLADTLKTAVVLGLTMTEAHAATTAAVMNCLQLIMSTAMRLGYVNAEQARTIFSAAAEAVIRDYNRGERDVNTHSN